MTLSQNLTAALRLRELILDGDLPGGTRVSEIPLSERLGVSRTPLRLALGQLQHEGLLEALPGGGFAVRLFTRDQVMDAIDLRGLLEGAAARLAAERRRGPDELEAIHGCVRQLDLLFDTGRLESENFERYVALNERFHALLIAGAGSEAITGAYERALALPFASPSAFVLLQADLPGSQRTMYVAQRQHRDLLDAITHGEGARAEALAREHARLARENLDLALESEERLARLPGAGLIDRAGSPLEDAA
ncbi:MAG TPA: GntR family transcriptional regulator [Solirubrobacteraceae bacterium]|nr:GntR family transcriptional regulator [Solirubrobacteraceae bacterium]